MKAHYETIAVHRSPENLATEFAKIPYARYAPVRRQLLNVLRRVNDLRTATVVLQTSLIRCSILRRRPVKVYVDTEPETSISVDDQKAA